ncbi:hypothetical protein [Burkholderia sp. Bp9099]|uniref:hypothetical protein n=1 Tax=Burkholderia sp. Bp9099 TaxID=2184568 RepID=UPI001639CFFF|nr:hypothetical protein [Burkholderia sp. Bp9099]
MKFVASVISEQQAADCIADGEREWRDEYILSVMPSEEAQKKIARETVRGEMDIVPYLRGSEVHAYVDAAQVRAELQLEAERDDKHRRR